MVQNAAAQENGFNLYADSITQFANFIKNKPILTKDQVMQPGTFGSGINSAIQFGNWAHATSDVRASYFIATFKALNLVQ